MKKKSNGIVIVLSSLMVICLACGMLGLYASMKPANKKPEEDKKVFEEETGTIWVKSGDLGYITEDGVIFCNGRIKQMIIFEGHNVYPFYIENVLSQHPAVAKVAVIGVKDENSINSDIPTAIVELKEEYKYLGSQMIKELKSYSEIHLPLRDMAQQYVIIDEMPLNPNGKVDTMYLTQHFKELLSNQNKTENNLIKLLKKNNTLERNRKN